MGAPDPQFNPIAVTVALDEARQQHLAAAQAVVADAEALVIDGAPMAEYANTMLRDVKGRKTRIEAMHEDIVGPIRLALANARKWFTPAIEANEKAESIIKGKLMDFSRKEAERVAFEERARKDAERRAREQAERDAAAARARAEEAARKARQEAEAAATERKKQEEEAARQRADGNKQAAADAERRAQAAAAEQARKEEEERQRRENAEREAQRIQVESAARAAAAAPIVVAAAEVKGFGSRKNWGAELVEDATEDQAKLCIVKAIAAGRNDLLSLLTLDMKAANKLAKALEANFNVPGLKARNNPIPTSRG